MLPKAFMQIERAARVLADFEGVWVLNRVILQGSGGRATFEGQAVWTRAAEGLIYRETGALRMPGSPEMRAERCYCWRDGLAVFFEDGRFFHHVPATGGRARHWCDPDSYVVDYDFAGWPEFSTIWQVTGPKKRYEMTSHYRRPDRMSP